MDADKQSACLEALLFVAQSIPFALCQRRPYVPLLCVSGQKAAQLTISILGMLTINYPGADLASSHTGQASLQGRYQRGYTAAMQTGYCQQRTILPAAG